MDPTFPRLVILVTSGARLIIPASGPEALGVIPRLTVTVSEEEGEENDVDADKLSL